MDCILEELNYINPSSLSYSEWVEVGMALKHEGYPCSVWDSWSQKDVSRYHEGECFSKWDTFNGTGTPVTGGTIYQLAVDRGYQPPSKDDDYALDWDSMINDKEDHVVVKKGWLELQSLPKPQGKWTHDGVYCADDTIKYLELLFQEDEYVGVSFQAWENAAGKACPTQGVYSKTAGELIKAIHKHKGDLGAVFGDYRTDIGAWIRFNPLDGKGVKNENVTNRRYCLIESDSMSLEQQYSIMKELELPIVALVYSGGKSIHAITRIDARNDEEYRRRVDFTYSVCQKNGLQIDVQNRNPSRLSRLPGVLRKDKQQYLLATNIGKATWEEWKEWIESINDDLPDAEALSDVWENLPPLAEPLIEGVLRKGHKMLIAGPSKAGKSYALIELCCAMAEGAQWLGWDVAQGKVLYVNLELDRASCLHRFKDVYKAMQLKPNNISNIDIWNLRGNSVPMDKLAPRLIRRAGKKNYAAVIIDPIYKVITGDENSADQMAHFCNQFDRVCTELGSAVIYCHHHSKGYQGGKRSMDRASGSGVFARDPDALIDFTQLEIKPSDMKNIEKHLECETYKLVLRNAGIPLDYGEKIAKDPFQMFSICQQRLRPEISDVAKLMAEKLKRDTIPNLTAWRIEGTLREFASFPPKNVAFTYPIHNYGLNGILADLEPEVGLAPWERAVKKRKEIAEQQPDKLSLAYAALSVNGEPVTYKALADYMECSTKSVKNYIKKCGKFTTKLCKNGAQNEVEIIPIQDEISSFGTFEDEF